MSQKLTRLKKPMLQNLVQRSFMSVLIVGVWSLAQDKISNVDCFSLQLNEDLVGHIDFLAQTGPFSVPIRCVTKKCQVNEMWGEF